MTLRATGTRLIVEQVEAATTSAGGIVLKTQQEPSRARVISVGPEVKEEIVKGDLLYVEWNRVAKIPFEGQTYYLVDINSVMAKLI